MQLRQFSHKLWILERSTLKESDHSILKKYRLIRTAQKFELVFGDIFVILLVKPRNPLINCLTKDFENLLVKRAKSTKMSPKTTSNFHAARINRYFF